MSVNEDADCGGKLTIHLSPPSIYTIIKYYSQIIFACVQYVAGSFNAFRCLTFGPFSTQPGFKRHTMRHQVTDVTCSDKDRKRNVVDSSFPAYLQGML